MQIDYDDKDFGYNNGTKAFYQNYYKRAAQKAYNKCPIRIYQAPFVPKAIKDKYNCKLIGQVDALASSMHYNHGLVTDCKYQLIDHTISNVDNYQFKHVIIINFRHSETTSVYVNGNYLGVGSSNKYLMQASGSVIQLTPKQHQLGID